jgi:hypothetical protein
MLLGATSDGFPHIYGRSPTLALGGFRAVVRAVFGRLTESEYFDQDDTNDTNLLTALRVELGLPGLPGSQVAVTSMIRQRWDSDLSFEDVVRLDPRSGGRRSDAIAAVTFLLPVASIGLRLHGTWGRGDSFLNAEDLLTEVDHNQFWAIGLHQAWRYTEHGPSWSLSTEHASSVASPSQLTYRGPQSLTVYRHWFLRQGYTNLGQLIGPSIGPGARATYMSLERASGARYWGVLVERILWDIDAFRGSGPIDLPTGQDRELLFGGRVGTNLQVSGVDGLRLDAFGGVSFRWNRQYVRFTSDLLSHPERETNFWLDLRLTWTPDRENDGS